MAQDREEGTARMAVMPDGRQVGGRGATKLVLAIVQDEDAPVLSDAVVAQGFRATRINTVGGFLRKGNATILIGVDERQVPLLLSVIRQTCRTRMAYLTATYPVEMAEPFLSEPIEVQVGGAVVFILDVDRFEQL